MELFRRFLPDKIDESAYSIDYDAVFSDGIRAIIFDIDNTLVAQNAPADETVCGFFRELHQKGFRTCLISNNSEARVRPFAELTESFYLFNAGKPLLRSYTQAMTLLKSDLDTTLFIGDQILTDIFGAKRLGMKHILVRPLDPKHEYFRIKLKRILERPIINAYYRKHPETEQTPEAVYVMPEAVSESEAEKAEDRAERIVEKAEKRAGRIVEKAEAKAERVTKKAEKREARREAREEKKSDKQRT